jgi:hypothetical protein
MSNTFLPTILTLFQMRKALPILFGYLAKVSVFFTI